MSSRSTTKKGRGAYSIPEDIPEEVCTDLGRIGGIEGLCTRLPPQEDLESVCRIHHALSDPIRMKILCLLLAQPLCVCVIKQCVRIADSKLSYHLGILKENGLIEGRSEKNWIIYRLTDKGKLYSGELLR